MNENNLTYKDILNKIKNNESFAISRFGDGEFSAIFNYKGHNCDGHYYYKNLGEALKRVLLEYKCDDNYFIGLQTLAYLRMGDKINNFMEYNQELNFCDADVIHKKNENSGLYDLFSLLNDKNVVYIAPDRLHSMTRFFNIDYFISIPLKNAWEEYYNIYNKLKEINTENTIYLFSCGMMAEVLINDLYKLNNKNTYIDIGSAFDPYCNILSRRYHSKVKVK